MPIIFPDRCRNITYGALVQLRQQGVTTGSGGVFDVASARALCSIETDIHFSKQEPAGIFMSKLDESKEKIDSATDALMDSQKRLVAAAKDANKELSTVTGKMRDGTEKLGAAIEKMAKITGHNGFSETVALTVKMVDALEKLAVLEEKGLLEKVMRSLAAPQRSSLESDL